MLSCLGLRHVLYMYSECDVSRSLVSFLLPTATAVCLGSAAGTAPHVPV
jgi:hypothetical protein